MHRRLFLTTLLSLPLVATAADDGQKDKDIEQGRADALRDIAAGKLEWHHLGFPPPWRPVFARLLKERFNVTSKEVGDCEPDMPLARHTKGYNEALTAELEKRFGKGAVDKAEAEAKATFEKQGP